MASQYKQSTGRRGFDLLGKKKFIVVCLLFSVGIIVVTTFTAGSYTEWKRHFIVTRYFKGTSLPTGRAQVTTEEGNDILEYKVYFLGYEIPEEVRVGDTFDFPVHIGYHYGVGEDMKEGKKGMNKMITLNFTGFMQQYESKQYYLNDLPQEGGFTETYTITVDERATQHMVHRVTANVSAIIYGENIEDKLDADYTICEAIYAPPGWTPTPTSTPTPTPTPTLPIPIVFFIFFLLLPFLLLIFFLLI